MQALYGQTLKDGPTIIDTGASHNVIGTNAARKVLEQDQRSRASKLSRRRQSLAMGLKGKKDEQAETISNSGTDITWWKDRVGPQGDPQLPVLETMPKNVKQCHMSVDDDNVTVDYADCCQVPTGQFATACPTTSGPPKVMEPPRAPKTFEPPTRTMNAEGAASRRTTHISVSSQMALTRRRSLFAHLSQQCRERKKAYEADEKAMSKRTPIERWEYFYKHKMIQRQFADTADILKILRFDRKVEGLTSDTVASLAAARAKAKPSAKKKGKAKAQAKPVPMSP